MSRISLRVRMGPDGKTPERELIVEDMKVAELSYVEALEFAMQIVSSLRFEPRRE